MATALGAVLDGLSGPPYVLIGPVVDRAHPSLVAQLRALLIDACREPPRVNGLACMAYLRCGPRYFLRQAKQMQRYRTEAGVSELRVPILVLRGARSRSRSARVRSSSGGRGRARLRARMRPRWHDVRRPRLAGGERVMKAPTVGV